MRTSATTPIADWKQTRTEDDHRIVHAYVAVAADGQEYAGGLEVEVYKPYLAYGTQMQPAHANWSSTSSSGCNAQQIVRMAQLLLAASQDVQRLNEGL